MPYDIATTSLSKTKRLTARRLGAMSTLLWVTLTPLNGEADAVPRRYRLQSFAIGDCCLFHLRGGHCIRSFPMQSASEFDLTPNMIGSINRKQDQLLEFQAIKDLFLPGDLLALCTDALAMWALGRHEAGCPVNWEDYWEMSFETWEAEIAALRGERQMRYDDTTLVLLRMVEETAAPEADEVAVEIVEEPIQ